MTTRIALLGAESSGKTALSQALAQSLTARGLAVELVPELLRQWCLDAGRTPRAEEQDGIARAHAAAIASAAAKAPELLIADTTPLMVAVYSDLLFGDRTLYPFALEHQRSYALTLVMGLDLPWVADGIQRDGPQVQAPVDALVRAALDRAGLPFQVVYGHGPARLARAERALRALPVLAARLGALPDAPTAARWRCACDGDAACEHRLFRRLQDY
nr:ATP-binding protein [Variovorax boronicumulans]